MINNSNNAVADIDDFFKPEASHLNLESDELKGDMGLTGFVIKSVAYDTIVVNFVDVENGLKKDGKFYLPASNDVKAWRRAEVLMVGSSVRHYKVGDLVIFPGVKGIEAGEINVMTSDGEVVNAKYGHFLSENRIFGIVEPM